MTPTDVAAALLAHLPPQPATVLVPAALLGGALSGTAGAVAGAAARRLLARLRRGARIARGPCEALTGLLWAVTGAAAAAGAVPVAWVPPLLGLGWLAVAAAAVDVRHRRLPDALTLPALPAALLLVAPLGGAALLRAAVVAAAAAAAHAAVHLLAPRALGAGDVKLAAPLGAVLGAAAWPAAVLAALLASVATAAVGLAVRARRGAAVPHGPSMLAATWLVATLAVSGTVGAG